MLIHVKLSDRWPESQQPDSETDYKWAKRQQPLACCGATDDSGGGQEVESSVLNPPPSLHPSIHQPIPLLATIHSGWLIDGGKRERSDVKIIQLCQNCVTCYGLSVLSIAATVTMWHVVRITVQIKVKWYLFNTSHSARQVRRRGQSLWAPSIQNQALWRLAQMPGCVSPEVDSVYRLFLFLSVLFFCFCYVSCSRSNEKEDRGVFLWALKLQTQPVFIPERLNRSIVNVSQNGIYLHSQNCHIVKVKHIPDRPRTLTTWSGLGKVTTLFGYFCDFH